MPCFFSSFKEFLLQEGINKVDLMYRKFDLINELLINECYLENSAKFKYIASFDTDELIIPRIYYDYTIDSDLYKNYSAKIKSIDSLLIRKHIYQQQESRTKSKLISYIRKMVYGTQWFFSSGWYLKNSLVDNICQYLDENGEIIKNFNYSNPMLFNISDLDVKKEKTETFINLVVNDYKTILYVKSICNLNENFIKPIFKRYNKLERKISNFFRFFFSKLAPVEKVYTTLRKFLIFSLIKVPGNWFQSVKFTIPFQRY